MVNAVAHILTPIITLDVYRNYIAKKKFALSYILIAGIGGILPDLDMIAYWVLHAISGTILIDVHRTITHSLLIPAILIAVALASYKFSKKLFWMILALTFGYLTHIFLDYTVMGTIMPFYPLSTARYGLNIVPYTELGRTIITGIDAIMLTLWLVYEFSKKNIKDFI